MDQASFIQQGKAIEKLLRKYPHKGGAESSELVLFDELIQVYTQQFKY